MDMQDYLQNLSTQAESDVELARIAMLLAQDEYPELDIDQYLAQLDHYAAQIRERLADDEDSPVAILRAMNELLFSDLGFSGNIDDYYDPRNSFLNDVLDRRIGIPITLSIVYLDDCLAFRIALNRCEFSRAFFGQASG